MMQPVCTSAPYTRRTQRIPVANLRLDEPHETSNHVVRCKRGMTQLTTNRQPRNDHFAACEKAFKIRPWAVHHLRAAARSNLTGVSSPFTGVVPRTVYVRRGGMSCAEG